MSDNSEILQKIEELRAQLKAEEEKVQLQQEQERFENSLSKLDNAIKRVEGLKKLIDYFKQNVVYGKDITFLARVDQFDKEYTKWESHKIDRSSIEGINEA